MSIPPVENPTCAALEEYEEVPQTVSLEFTEDDVTFRGSCGFAGDGGLGVLGERGREGGDGTQRALGALEFLTQEEEPSGTTPVDARNGFNELSRLAMLWTVQHRWPSGARFLFN